MLGGTQMLEAGVCLEETNTQKENSKAYHLEPSYEMWEFSVIEEEN